MGDWPGGDGAPFSHSLDGLGFVNWWLASGVGGDILGGIGTGTLLAL